MAIAFRQRRLGRFLSIVDEVVAEKGTCRILDVGGKLAYWQALEPLWGDRPCHITLVNLASEPVSDAALFKCCRERLRSRPIRRPVFRPGAFEFGDRACRPLAGSVPHGRRSAPAGARAILCRRRISGFRSNRISGFRSSTGCRNRGASRSSCAALAASIRARELMRRSAPHSRRCAAARLQRHGGVISRRARSNASALPASPNR